MVVRDGTNLNATSLRSLNWLERVHIFFHLAQLPLYLIYKLISSFFVGPHKFKTWRRVLGDASLRHVTSGFSMRQIQALFGTSENTYRTWAKRWGLPVVIEDVEGDSRAKLFWIGPKRLDKLILYVHGGGYFVPIQYTTLSFWLHVKRELSSKGIETGLTVLSYSLFPEHQFPTQLTQLVTALTHFFSKGLSPSDVHLVGDSAGGNLILTLMSHILHPLPRTLSSSRLQTHYTGEESVSIDTNPRALSLPLPFRGIYLMSPWVSLVSLTPGNTYAQNSAYDMYSMKAVREWGKAIIDNVEEEDRVYLDPNEVPLTSSVGKTPDDAAWFHGWEHLVTKRMLITAGGNECLLGDCALLAKGLEQAMSKNSCARSHSHGTERDLDSDPPHGIHDDACLDFVLWHKGLKVGSLTKVILTWLEEGMKE